MVRELKCTPLPQCQYHRHAGLVRARLDWQLGTKNTFMLSYGAWRNDMDNVGVGGTNLQESGYTSNQYDDVYDARRNYHLISPHACGSCELTFYR